MAAGDFTASLKAEVVLRMGQMFGDARERAVYDAPIETIRTVINQQTANVAPIEGTRTKDNRVRVHWIDARGLEGTDPITADCTPNGIELESADAEYALDMPRQAKNFEVKIDIDLRDNEYEAAELIAKGLMKQKAELDKYFNRAVLAKLITFAGTNSLPVGYFDGWDVGADGSTYINDDLWDGDLFLQFMLAVQFNYFTNPEFIHGMNYNVLSKIYQFNNDEANLRKIGVNRHHFDPLTFNELDINSLSVVIDKGAVAFASKTYHPDAPVQRPGDRTIFTVNSSIPGMKYDVTKADTCVEVVGVGEETVSVYTMRGLGGLFLNPEFTTGNTGVLVLNKGTRPAPAA